MNTILDPIILTQQLIRERSITPEAVGTLDILQSHLEPLGFICYRLTFADDDSPAVDNLYARWGTTAPHFCFAGHVDVVPAGHHESWRHDPFAGHIDNGILYGRGAVDMKGAIAAFLSSTTEYLTNHQPQGSISFLITADEEGIAINGTKKVLQWLSDRQEKIDFCLVGEPICQDKVGDTIKIGRRGSMNTVLTVQGRQGHVAYPERADNPIPKLMQCLMAIDKGPEEQTGEFFAMTNVEITSIDVNNPTVNIIPQQAVARFNIRFSDAQTADGLQRWLHNCCQRYTQNYTLDFSISGEAEYLEPERYTKLLQDVIQEITGLNPTLTTAGGTSDARFIRHCAPVLEFGLVGQSMHQVNEHVFCIDLYKLTNIYYNFLIKYFNL